MKNFSFVLLGFLVFLTSCGTQRKAVAPEEFKKETKVGYAPTPDFADLAEETIEDLEEGTLGIIDHALQYLGTRYKYGGTTPEGMDCSGLVYTCFLEKNISLPRSSRDMARLGEQLDLGQVGLGDLLFFKTNRRAKDINHVGIVVKLEDDNIYFIHSSTSRGVIISALQEDYWREHFIMARRIL